MIEKNENESYLHNEAKQLLLKWLRNAAEKATCIPKGFCV